MTDRDLLLERAIGELRKLPPLDSGVLARIVTAAGNARISRAADEPMPVMPARPRFARLTSVVAMTAAAAVIGFLIRGVSLRESGQPAARIASAAPDSLGDVMHAVASRDRVSMPVPTQFVFSGRAASRVSLIGDFNNWNRASSPMHREANSALWSVTLPVVPGRHMYAFLVNDSLFTLDPEAPRAKDPDLDVAGSIIIVGRP
jgi:Carbohydrate-binding module 48 (Isoamylase N-terminal domain)